MNDAENKCFNRLKWVVSLCVLQTVSKASVLKILEKSAIKSFLLNKMDKIGRSQLPDSSSSPPLR